MLTVVLDQWEVLLQLHAQQQTWQQRWDDAQEKFQSALAQLPTQDANRLKNLLAIAMPSGQSFPLSFGVDNSNAASTVGNSTVAGEPLTESSIEPSTVSADLESIACLQCHSDSIDCACSSNARTAEANIYLTPKQLKETNSSVLEAEELKTNTPDTSTVDELDQETDGRLVDPETTPEPGTHDNLECDANQSIATTPPTTTPTPLTTTLTDGQAVAIDPQTGQVWEAVEPTVATEQATTPIEVSSIEVSSIDVAATDVEPASETQTEVACLDQIPAVAADPKSQAAQESLEATQAIKNEPELELQVDSGTESESVEATIANCQVDTDSQPAESPTGETLDETLETHAMPCESKGSCESKESCDSEHELFAQMQATLDAEAVDNEAADPNDAAEETLEASTIRATSERRESINAEHAKIDPIQLDDADTRATLDSEALSDSPNHDSTPVLATAEPTSDLANAPALEPFNQADSVEPSCDANTEVQTPEPTQAQTVHAEVANEETVPTASPRASNPRANTQTQANIKATVDSEALADLDCQDSQSLIEATLDKVCHGVEQASADISPAEPTETADAQLDNRKSVEPEGEAGVEQAASQPDALSTSAQAPESDDTSLAAEAIEPLTAQATANTPLAQAIKEPVATAQAATNNNHNNNNVLPAEQQLANELEELQQWAIQTIGDGIPENELFKKLRTARKAALSQELVRMISEDTIIGRNDDNHVIVKDA